MVCKWYSLYKRIAIDTIEARVASVHVTEVIS